MPVFIPPGLQHGQEAGGGVARKSWIVDLEVPRLVLSVDGDVGMHARDDKVITKRDSDLTAIQPDVIHH